ncbi:MAG: YvcK family protein [Actinobacteria bacterium]|nr:YvcK family protein [Actinomycetota bacterium]
MTVLCGGLGGARLALAAVEGGTASSTTFVTNVADDWDVGGLPVCPDTDAVLYALSGRFDTDRGWEVRGDVFPGPRHGEPSWFGIGDLDRATHQRRRSLLESGATLADATDALAAAAGAVARVIPATDHPVRTRIRTSTGWNGFQEWLVRDRAPHVDEVRWVGLTEATASRGVVDAVDQADLVVIASSSPIASLAPILGIAEIRGALERRSRHSTRPTLALSPVVIGRPPTTERDRHREAARVRLPRSVGIEHTHVAIARWLAPLVSHFAVDPSDASWSDDVAETGVIPVLAPVIGADVEERRDLVALFDSMAQGAARRSASMHPVP